MKFADTREERLLPSPNLGGTVWGFRAISAIGLHYNNIVENIEMHD